MPTQQHLANTSQAAQKGFKDAVVITLGTGIGSGIILGGKILRGFNFAAGEMGHTVIVKGGRKCNCGRYGCWSGMLPPALFRRMPAER